MPCYTIRLTTTAFEVADLGVLKDALEKDYNARCTIHDGGHALTANIIGIGTVSFRNGQVSLRAGQEDKLDGLKQSYARQALRVVSQRFNWRLSEKKPNQFEAVRRF